MAVAAIGRWTRGLGDTAKRRGLVGGSRAWLAVFAGLQVIRFAGRVAKRGEKPVHYSEPLRPGETLEIRHLAPDR